MLIFAANVCLGRYMAIYYSEIAVNRRLMGLLFFVMSIAQFCGGLFWSTIVDRTGNYKGTLTLTSLIEIVVVFCYLTHAVQHNFTLLFIVTLMHGCIASVSSPIVDALCLKVLAEQPDSKEAYGDQRLWSAVGWGGMALIVGRLVDVFGISSIFYAFAAVVSLNVGIILKWMPSGKKPPDLAAGSPESTSSPQEKGSLLKALQNFDALWFFANLMIYGGLMSLVENFLNVFLLQDFIGTQSSIIGAATGVMCLFEIPVFKYINRAWRHDENGLVKVLIASELVLALRCVLYVLLPRGQPWLVLLVEPLHGFTFAAMWCATVEYAKRLAPPGTQARMQALVNGLFFNVSFAFGSLVWGRVVRLPPNGLGFSRSFIVNAIILVSWLSIWCAGLVLARKRSLR